MFKEELDISFFAQQRVADDDKDLLHPLFSNVYMNCANAFIGINAAGKTSVLKVILLALNLLNNQPINHIETKEILGDTDKAVINIYFHSETKEICRLETVITSEKSKTEPTYYKIVRETLWTKPQESVTARKNLADFSAYEPVAVRKEEEFLSDDVSIIRDGKTFETRYLRKGFHELISVIRILDSRRENFKLSKAYESKVDVINVITAPEIEMLIIFNKDKYNEFKMSGKKPSILCKENLRMSSVKSYDFVKDYFENPEILVQAIKKYNEISKIRKGEYTLLDFRDGKSVCRIHQCKVGYVFRYVAGLTDLLLNKEVTHAF